MPNGGYSMVNSTDERADEGYFGPDSVSWRLFTDPSSKLGGMAALLMQALNPGMMMLFSKASSTPDMGGDRVERTGRYIDTTIFGDKAHADAAGEQVRRMHHNATWTDPTGTTLRADSQPWLAWTHNAVVWGVVRGAEAFGPELTAAEKDQFVLEQHAAAKLVGVETDSIPSTWQELQDEIEAGKDWLALCLPAANVAATMRKPPMGGNPIAAWTGIIIQDGMLSLLPEWALNLYGITRPKNLQKAARATARILARARKSESASARIHTVIEQVQAKPYRKIRH